MFAFDNQFVSGISESFTQTYLQVLLLISCIPNHCLLFVSYCLSSMLVCQLKCLQLLKIWVSIYCTFMLRLKGKILDGFFWVVWQTSSPGQIWFVHFLILRLCGKSPCLFFFFFFFFSFVFPSSLNIRSVFKVFWFKLLSILYCLEILGGPAVSVARDLKKCCCWYVAFREIPHSWGDSTKLYPAVTQL